MLFAGRFEMPTRFVFVFIAITVGILVFVSGLDREISSELHSLGIFGSFVAGAFYTFGITTPTAFIILIEMMEINGAIVVALSASIVAAAVDTILFVFVRKQLEKNASKIMKGVHKRFGRNILFYPIGFFIFGTPLPDELGLAFMQISEIKPVKIFLVIASAKFITLMITYSAVSQVVGHP